jgi:hypothetical protein
MTSNTSSTTRSASKRAPRATPRTVPPTVADVVTPVGLDLDADIADVVATHGTLDTIESGHAAALVALTERTDYALSEYVRLARVWKSQRRPSAASMSPSGRVTKTPIVVSCSPVSCGMHTRRCPT